MNISHPAPIKTKQFCFLTGHFLSCVSVLLGNSLTLMSSLQGRGGALTSAHAHYKARFEVRSMFLHVVELDGIELNKVITSPCSLTEWQQTCPSSDSWSCPAALLPPRGRKRQGIRCGEGRMQELQQTCPAGS